MRALRDVWCEITSFGQLETAYKKARKGKRYRIEVLVFKSDLDSNLLRIQDQLRNGTFQFGPYRRHWVYIPKKRIVMALPFDSRIVQWSIYLTLMPYFDKLMIEDSYACRVGKGSLAAVERLQYWLQQIERKPGDWYIIKIDISKYFYRVDHKVLLDILSYRIEDPELMAMLEAIINSDGEKFGLPRFTGPEDIPPEEWLSDVGMPIGNLTSQLFANIYLNELDQFCKHVLRIHYYIRYMDDILVVVNGKDKAKEIKERITDFLRERLRLDVNDKTTIRQASMPVEFVGYIVTAHKLKLRKPTVKRIKRSFRAICRYYFAGEMTKEEFDRRVASYKGVMSHCDCGNLEKRLNEIYIREKERAEEMSNLQMIEALCQLSEAQSKIIRAQAARLAELGAVCMTDEIAEADKLYQSIIGGPETSPNT